MAPWQVLEGLHRLVDRQTEKIKALLPGEISAPLGAKHGAVIAYLGQNSLLDPSFSEFQRNHTNQRHIVQKDSSGYQDVDCSEQFTALSHWNNVAISH
jgi:hypothetical protein